MFYFRQLTSAIYLITKKLNLGHYQWIGVIERRTTQGHIQNIAQWKFTAWESNNDFPKKKYFLTNLKHFLFQVDLIRFSRNKIKIISILLLTCSYLCPCCKCIINFPPYICGGAHQKHFFTLKHFPTFSYLIPLEPLQQNSYAYILYPFSVDNCLSQERWYITILLGLQFYKNYSDLTLSK